MSGRQTKEHIFDEAVRLFSEQGYAATTIRQIASAVKVNVATIYIYFQNKEGIFDEILSLFENKLVRYNPTSIHIKPRRERDGPQKYLSRLLWNYVIEDDLFMRRAFCIVCMEQYTSKKARALVRETLHDEVTENLRRALEELVERGEIPGFDTYSFALLWSRVLYSSAMLAAHGDSPEEKNNLRAANELMLDMAVSGKIPEAVNCVGAVNSRVP